MSEPNNTEVRLALLETENRTLTKAVEEQTRVLRDIDDKLGKDFTAIALQQQRIDVLEREINEVATIAREAEAKADKAKAKVVWICGVAFGAWAILQAVLHFIPKG